jgi:hypothetical protein
MQNFIVEFKNALSDDFCQHLISKFEGDPNKIPGRTGAGIDKQKKDSSDLYLSKLPDWQQENIQISQIIFQALTQYAKGFPHILTGAISPSFQDPQSGLIRTINAEDIQQLSDQQVANIASSIYRLDEVNLQKYQQAQGGYHHWHSEFYPHPSDPQQRSLHRVLLWLIYLNDVETGGETEFLYQQVKVKASRGSLVLAPCDFTHTHRGLVPESGDKYVLASWIMYQDAKTLYPKAP